MLQFLFYSSSLHSLDLVFPIKNQQSHTLFPLLLWRLFSFPILIYLYSYLPYCFQFPQFHAQTCQLCTESFALDQFRALMPKFLMAYSQPSPRTCTLSSSLLPDSCLQHCHHSLFPEILPFLDNSIFSQFSSKLLIHSSFLHRILI